MENVLLQISPIMNERIANYFFFQLNTIIKDELATRDSVGLFYWST